MRPYTIPQECPNDRHPARQGAQCPVPQTTQQCCRGGIPPTTACPQRRSSYSLTTPRTTMLLASETWGRYQRPLGRGASAAVHDRAEPDRDPVADDTQGDRQYVFATTSALKMTVRRAPPNSDPLTVSIALTQETRALRHPADAPSRHATYLPALRTMSDPTCARICAAAWNVQRARRPIVLWILLPHAAKRAPRGEISGQPTCSPVFGRILLNWNQNCHPLNQY